MCRNPLVSVPSENWPLRERSSAEFSLLLLPCGPLESQPINIRYIADVFISWLSLYSANSERLLHMPPGTFDDAAPSKRAEAAASAHSPGHACSDGAKGTWEIPHSDLLLLTRVSDAMHRQADAYANATGPRPPAKTRAARPGTAVFATGAAYGSDGDAPHGLIARAPPASACMARTQIRLAEFSGSCQI